MNFHLCMSSMHVFKCSRRNKEKWNIHNVCVCAMLARLLSISIKCETYPPHLRELSGWWETIYGFIHTFVWVNGVSVLALCSNTKCQHYTNMIQRTSDKKKLCKFVINFYSHIQKRETNNSRTPCRPFVRSRCTILKMEKRLSFTFRVNKQGRKRDYSFAPAFVCQIAAISASIIKCKAP